MAPGSLSEKVLQQQKVNMSGNLSIESFNCHGFNGCKPFLCDILSKCDILCLQELMISKQDCHMLNTFHRDYLGYGVSPVDASLGVLSGRPYGGVGYCGNKQSTSMLR